MKGRNIFFFFALLLGAAPLVCAAESAQDPVQPTWDSIRANYRTPEWFRDAKFGIFMHWGIYSVPAHHSEWYVRYMYSPGADAEWHRKNFGPQDKFGYKDFIPMFTAAKWDPGTWAKLFRQSGAKYIVPTAEHHDGWANWDSTLTKWNAMRMGPKRDLIGDLAKAVRKEGLRFGVSNHRMEHFTFIPLNPSIPSDLLDPAYADFYSTADRSPVARQRFLDDWIARVREVIDKYQPDMLWFDNGVNSRSLDPQKLAVAAYYYNRALEWKKEVSLSTKGEAYLAGSIRDYERQGRAPREIKDFAWQVDDPIGNKFGYVTEIEYKPASLLVRRLVDTVSMNGNYLLNISPMADGTIPQPQQERLLEIGAWLDVNGEAIYGTRPWTRYGEGPYYSSPAGSMRRDDPEHESYSAKEFRFTTKGDTLYAIGLDWPGAEAVITSLGSGETLSGQVARVELLGHKGRLQFQRDAEGLKVRLPARQPSPYAYALRITGLKLR